MRGFGLFIEVHIFQSINRHGMLFFVLSNISTGLINMSMSTIDVVDNNVSLGEID